MSGTDSGNGLPSEPGALSAKPGLRPHLPEESKKPPHAPTSRPRAGRAHSPPPTKPFPSSVYPLIPSGYSSQINSASSVSSYWSRSSRSSVNSGFSESRYSTTSLESDRTTYSEAIWPLIIPKGLTAWRSPEEILRQYDVMLAKAQRPPEANVRGLHAREFRERIAKLMVSLKDYDPLVILRVTVNGNLPVCRRLDNDMINGTQLLYALAKGQGQRYAGDLILKAEKQKHVVHSSDNTQLQGIWIPFERALGYANKVGAIEQFFPLFLEDLIPTGPTDIENRVEEFLTEEAEIRSVEKDVVMVKNESLVRYEKGCELEEDEPPGSSDIGSKAMAELNLKEDDLTEEDAKLPIPSIAHVLACEDPTENEGLPASQPLSTSTSTTTQSASDASTLSNDETTAPSTIELRELLLTRLMDYFFSVFASSPLRRVQHPDGSSSSSARPASTTSLGQPTIDPTRTNTNKRRRISGDGNGQDGEDDDLSKRKSQDRTSDQSNRPTKRRLACPYFKNNPRKFQEERSCCGPGWWTVHRVKEHLYRNHAMPLHCLRCHQVFSSNLELEEHSRRPDPTEQCMLNPDLPSFLQGRFNSDQEKLLRSRRRTLPKEASEEEKWIAVYRILFPAGDPALIPSSYYELQDGATLRLGDGDEDTAGQDTSELEGYESFLRRELPVHVRRELEVRINETLFPLEESLRGQLVDIVRDVQLNLYEAYKASRAENDGLYANTEAPAGSDIDLEQGGTVDNGADIDIDVTGGASNIDPAQNVWFAEQAESAAMVAGTGLDDELAAFRPAEPYVEQSLGDFDGLLFDFPGPVPGSGSGVADFLTTMEGRDSGYGGSITGCSDVVGTGWAW